ncbi:unnamed protein product [Arabis nemorensis]|uniref:Uncharacterized protein n=1 Tax=Arabis nemorensis TaxID=586526 RepID=A0A565CLB8_9BRAS|nr:unnamed protein product [Arabis nemorensis]
MSSSRNRPCQSVLNNVDLVEAFANFHKLAGAPTFYDLDHDEAKVKRFRDFPISALPRFPSFPSPHLNWVSLEYHGLQSDLSAIYLKGMMANGNSSIEFNMIPYDVFLFY